MVNAPNINCFKTKIIYQSNNCYPLLVFVCSVDAMSCKRIVTNFIEPTNNSNVINIIAMNPALYSKHLRLKQENGQRWFVKQRALAIRVSADMVGIVAYISIF